MAEIEHVIVLALENRSFDHMLGFLQHPDGRFDGLRGDGPYENPGWDGGPSVSATPTAKTIVPVGPDHSHEGVMEQLAVRGIGRARRPTNQGFRGKLRAEVPWFGLTKHLVVCLVRC